MQVNKKSSPKRGRKHNMATTTEANTGSPRSRLRLLLAIVILSLVANSIRRDEWVRSAFTSPTSAFAVETELSTAAPIRQDDSDDCVKTKQTSVQELEVISDRILGPDEYGKGCPKDCGCPNTPVDCPQHYNTKDVDMSANAVFATNASMHFAAELERRHADALRGCTQEGKQSGDTGGWCLGKRKAGKVLSLPDGRQIKVPSGHVPPSNTISKTLENFFRRENVTTVSDFGAGVGQYGIDLKTQIPHIVYRGYDGAGDIEPFTSGFLDWFDLTLPLDLPVSEWVISLEVGEHIPSKFEGMVVRNLHRHNCKGIILSWGVLGQGGENHINLHTNEYVTKVFDELGYKREHALEQDLRSGKTHEWFNRSTMVFRRRVSTCGD